MIRQRIADHLGWSLEETKGFPLQALRDLVKNQGLKADISEAIRSGGYILGLSSDALCEPFCACGRVISQCDGSRKGCGK